MSRFKVGDKVRYGDRNSSVIGEVVEVNGDSGGFKICWPLIDDEGSPLSENITADYESSDSRIVLCSVAVPKQTTRPEPSRLEIAVMLLQKLGPRGCDRQEVELAFYFADRIIEENRKTVVGM